MANSENNCYVRTTLGKGQQLLGKRMFYKTAMRTKA